MKQGADVAHAIDRRVASELEYELIFGFKLKASAPLHRSRATADTSVAKRTKTLSESGSRAPKCRRETRWRQEMRATRRRLRR